MSVRRSGPELPYKLVAGVTPVASSWVVASAKLIGVTFAPEEPRLYETFLDVLNERPAFSVIVVNAPIGYIDEPGEGARACDRVAQSLLGIRGKAIHDAPSRALLEGRADPDDEHLDVATATLLPRFREVAIEMSPFRQRVVFEGEPELSFYQLNGQVPLRHSKKTETGLNERRDLLMSKIQGIERIIEAEIPDVSHKHLLDAAALLWTARRVFARGAKRIPQDPEWDSLGLRTEFVM
jgi:predicted RNase H-like nuclease